MNRRSFITTGGCSVAGVAAVELGLPHKAMAQSSGWNDQVYGNANAAHAIASANGVYSAPAGSYWSTCGNAVQQALSDWQANNYDAQLQGNYASMNSSQIHSGALNQQQILQSIQPFMPNFTISDVQQALSYLDMQDRTAIDQTIANLQTKGMAYYLQILVQQAPVLANYIDSSSSSSQAAPAAIRNQTNVRSVRRGGNAQPLWNRIAQPPGDSGGGYSCATDGALIFGAGIAFATLSVMTLGTVDVLAGAAWAGIALWGGLGTTAWGVGHVVAGCGF